MNKMLTIKNLVLERDGRKILHGVDLEVNAGEIHAIIGPNGSGNSTLAYVLMGCSGYEPTNGKLTFNKTDITNASVTTRAKSGITLSWQEPARFEGISVRDYLSLGKKNDVTSPENIKDMRAALELVNLNPGRYLDRAIDQKLSGGERKRIDLASIITLKPKLAILDEPDSGIDFVSLDDLLDVLIKLKENTTIILITHREEVLEISDRATLLCNGYVVKGGSPPVVKKYFRDVCMACPTEKYSGVEGKHGI